MKTYKKSFPCKAKLRVEIGNPNCSDSQIVKIFITPNGSPDVKITGPDGKEIFSQDIKEIRFDLWRSQLDAILAGLAKASK